MIGKVKCFDVQKKFGFVFAERNQEMFVHFKDVVPDSLGHRCLNRGERVRFDIEKRQKGLCCTNVTAIDRPKMSRNRHREISQFTDWCDAGRFVGYAKRSCGEGELLFNVNSVVTEGLDILYPGMFLRHGIKDRHRPSVGSPIVVEASDVEIFEPDFIPSQADYDALAITDSPENIAAIEDCFEAAAELPVEEPSVLSQHLRKKTLLEIVQARKALSATAA